LSSRQTVAVQYRGRACRFSRSISRPVTWSICASISITAAMPLSRWARAGCRAGVARICARMSGEALMSTQSLPLDETAIEDCVRARARTPPLRKPAQLRQLQFH
jgi:hypothetical protein